MITAYSENRDITRNSSCFKKIKPRKSIEIKEEEDEHEEQIQVQASNIPDHTIQSSPPPSRPVRTRHEPVHFKDYVKH